MKNKNKHFFLIAGESSGDLHGSELIVQLKGIEPNISFAGIGGPLMQKEGLASIAPIEKMAVMGFWEVIKQIRFFLTLEKKTLKNIRTNSSVVDGVILIDYPGFNLRIAKKIKEEFPLIPIIYYISPQVWAWKEKRIRNIKKYVDRLIAIFPFEVDWYKNRGISIEYFGHPLIDQWKKRKQSNANNKLQKFTVGLFPGSRKQELDKHLPVFIDLVKNKHQINYEVEFVVSQPSLVSSSLFGYFQQNKIPVLSCSLYETLEKCDLAVVASGTATLECAISNTPFIVIYKMSFVSWFVTRRLINLKFASIVNILANKQIVPELLQKNLNIKNIIKQINHFLDKKTYNNTKKELVNVVNLLGDGRAYEQAAKLIYKESNC